MNDEFQPGRLVLYVPYHAHGDMDHVDCEKGVITSVREETVFVRFRGETSQGCKRDQLVLL